MTCTMYGKGHWAEGLQSNPKPCLAGTPKGFQVRRAVFVKLVAMRLLTEPGSSAPVNGAAYRGEVTAKSTMSTMTRFRFPLPSLPSPSSAILSDFLTPHS